MYVNYYFKFITRILFQYLYYSCVFINIFKIFNFQKYFLLIKYKIVIEYQYWIIYMNYIIAKLQNLIYIFNGNIL